jgi:hypothetical protein
MLLRASRSAESLTKEALLGSLGRFAAGVGRGLVKSPVKSVGLAGKMGRGMGGFGRKHWKGLAGTALVGAVAAPAVAQSVRKARVGLSPQYIQAQKYGVVPRMRAGG